MIQIDPTSPIPLYRQIADEFRRLIVLGAIRPGERLPTVRELASSVRVNRNTAARAVQLLESEGLVRSRVGRGTFVETRQVAVDMAQGQATVDASIDRLLVEAQTVGVPVEELPGRLRSRIERFRDGDPAAGRVKHE